MYRLLRENEAAVIRLSDGAIIYPDSGGRHWREYLNWMYAGNTPALADPINEPAQLVTKASIYGKLSDDELDLIFSARETWPLRMKLMWDDAPNNLVSPDNPILIEFLDSVIGEARRREVLGS